jgi:hypothetical protein
MRTALMMLVVALALAIAACGGDEEEAPATPTATATATAAATASPAATPSPAASPSPPAATPTAAAPTPTATPTPPPATSPTAQVEGCPDEDRAFCAFADQVEQALLNEDVDFFVANSLTVSIPCTQEQAVVGYVCDQSQIGETITGVPYGDEASQGALLESQEYRDFWAELFASDLTEEEDDEGSGELRIWGVGYSSEPGEGKPRNLVLTYIGDSDLGALRQSLGIHIPIEEGRWQVYSLLQYAPTMGRPQERFVVWRDWPR